MPRPCSICSHPERESIDQALAEKEPYRIVAKRFETSKAALQRHKQGHTPAPANASLESVVTSSKAGEYVAVPMGDQTDQATTLVGAAALVNAARQLDAAARHVHEQTRDLRSIHQPELLTRLEDVARVLVEVTGVVVQLAAAAGDPVR